MIERNVADSVRAVLVDPYPTGRIALGRGPRQAMRHVDLNLRTPQQKRIWLEEARLNAILGGCKKSLPSIRSGVRCYLAFASKQPRLDKCMIVAVSIWSGCYIVPTCDEKLDIFFPPSIDILVAWSNYFRSAGTYRNYVSYVKTACIVMRKPTSVRSGLPIAGISHSMIWCKVFMDDALRRAERTIKVNGYYAKRPKLFIQRCCQHGAATVVTLGIVAGTRSNE